MEALATEAPATEALATIEALVMKALVMEALDIRRGSKHANAARSKLLLVE